MRVIARGTLVEYWNRHPETEGPLKSWHAKVKAAVWQSPRDVINDFNTAKIVSADRVLFKICGNNYRLIVAFKYSAGIAFIKFIGTHKEYDKINAAKISRY